MSNTIDFMLSAFVLSSELWGCCFSVPEVESEPRPRYVPPPFPPQLAPPPPPTPEQIKAQEKRARKAAKWAKLNQADLDPRAVAKLVNSGYPGGLGCPKQP